MRKNKKQKQVCKIQNNVVTEDVMRKPKNKDYGDISFSFYDSDSSYPDEVIIYIKHEDYLKLRSKLDLDYTKFGISYKEYEIFMKIIETFNIPYTCDCRDIPW